jgi:hypothetical protein
MGFPARRHGAVAATDRRGLAPGPAWLCRWVSRCIGFCRHRAAGWRQGTGRPARSGAWGFRPAATGGARFGRCFPRLTGHGVLRATRRRIGARTRDARSVLVHLVLPRAGTDGARFGRCFSPLTVHRVPPRTRALAAVLVHGVLATPERVARCRRRTPWVPLTVHRVLSLVGNDPRRDSATAPPCTPGRSSTLAPSPAHLPLQRKVRGCVTLSTTPPAKAGCS